MRLSILFENTRDRFKGFRAPISHELNLIEDKEIPKVYSDGAGNVFYRLSNGDFHREDGPAVEWPNGEVEYWINGKEYELGIGGRLVKKKKEIREEKQKKPTLRVSGDGSKYWYINGKLHREDGPAAEWSDGTKEWWFNGKLHREDGPAAEWSDGTKEWWFNGRRHREDGPAIEQPDGTKTWWLNGKRHREDGPAIERSDGSIEYWIDDEECELGIGGRLVRKVSTESVESDTHSPTLFEHVPVPWKIEGIGGREVNDYVNLFSSSLEASSMEEARERAQKMFEAIKGKEIQVPSMWAYSNSDSVYLHDGPYTVIPYEIDGIFHSESGWYDFTIDCDVPEGSEVERRGMTCIWLTAPTIRVV